MKNCNSTINISLSVNTLCDKPSKKRLLSYMPIKKFNSKEEALLAIKMEGNHPVKDKFTFLSTKITVKETDANLQ